MKPTAMIVDGDVRAQHTLRSVFQQLQVHALVASDALHALSLIQDSRVDVVLADAMLPGLDGCSLLEIVRRRHPGVIRILVSQHPTADMLIKAINRAAVHRVLHKELDHASLRHELSNTIHEYLTVRPLVDAIARPRAPSPLGESSNDD